MTTPDQTMEITGINEPAALARRLRGIASAGVVHVVLVMIGFLWLVPPLGLAVTSLRTRAASSQTGWWTAPWTGGWTLENYTAVLRSSDLPPPGFADSFANSLIICIPATILPIVIAATAAYALAWMEFRGRDWIFLGAVALLVVPLQVTWVPVLNIFNKLGLTASFWALWIAHTAFGLPFAVFLLTNFFREIPRELIEAARIDGASNVRIFTRVVLPLSTPALASLAIFQFVWVWNDLMNALLFLQDVEKFPLTVGIQRLLGTYGNEWHLLAAGTFISMSIPLIVFFSLQRYFVRGITAGSVKG